MGSAVAKPASFKLADNAEQVVMLMMPVYFTSELLSDDELQLAKSSWSTILNSTAPEYLRLRMDPRFPHETCILFFYHSFYERLFDAHPDCKELFRDMNSQGRFLVKMISLALSEKEDPVKYQTTLIRLAEVHNKRGIKAIEYGVVGEVLFWTICRCIGEMAYSHDLHRAWVKIYSRMLRTMVPSAVAYELRDGSAQLNRFAAHHLPMAPEEEGLLQTLQQKTKALHADTHTSAVDINNASIHRVSMHA